MARVEEQFSTISEIRVYVPYYSIEDKNSEVVDLEDSTFKSSLSDKVVDDVYRNNSFMPDKFNQKFGKIDISEDDELELPEIS